jgi:hypothetical protein
VSINLKQAEENERLLHTLIKDHPKDFFDWKINICFYATLHYVNSYIHKVDPDYPINNHHDSLSFLKRKAKDHIFISYKAIYKLCMDSRYTGFDDYKDFNDNNKTDFENVALPALTDIKAYCKKFIESK